MRANSRCRGPTCGGCCKTLEPCGLARIQDHPHRLLVTRRSATSVETYYAAMFETVLRTIDRYRSARAAA